MREDLLPTGIDGKLAHLIEEAAEVIKAAAKIQRFGLLATDGVTGIHYGNAADLLTEMDDLQHAMQSARDSLIPLHAAVIEWQASLALDTSSEVDDEEDRNPLCKARREGDEMVCAVCVLRWPVGEDPPPHAKCH